LGAEGYTICDGSTPYGYQRRLACGDEASPNKPKTLAQSRSAATGTASEGRGVVVFQRSMGLVD
jgi:hypothetical protein